MALLQIAELSTVNNCHCGREKKVEEPCCCTCVAIREEWNIRLAPIRELKAKFNAVVRDYPVYLNGWRVLQVTRGFVYRCRKANGERCKVLGGNDAIWQDLLEQAGVVAS